MYRDIIFSLLTIFGEGVIISWHHIFTPHNIWRGGDYIVTSYSHLWQYLVRGDYIVTLYFHSWQYLMRVWLYRDIIFSLLTTFGEGVIISWHHIFTPDNIGEWWLYRDIIFSLLTIFGKGVIISWHYIFTPDDIWWGCDYIVTLYFHSWQYLVRGWLYRDIF